MLLMLTLGVCINSKAQLSAGLSGGIGLPMGDMGDKAKGGLATGFGGEIQGRYMLDDYMAVGLNVGFYNWGISATVPSGVTLTFTTMPIVGTFEYYFADDGFKPFAGVELGYTTWSAKAEGSVTVSGVTVNMSSSNSGGGLAFAPCVGAAFGLSDAVDVFAKAKYMYGMTEDTGKGATNLTYVGINLGVSLKFGN